MKQALIIGSTVADVTVRLPHLPVTGEDVIVESQSMSLGGCAYNVSEILRQSGVPYTLFSSGLTSNHILHCKYAVVPGSCYFNVITPFTVLPLLYPYPIFFAQ